MLLSVRRQKYSYGFGLQQGTFKVNISGGGGGRGKHCNSRNYSDWNNLSCDIVESLSASSRCFGRDAEINPAPWQGLR